VRSIRRRRRALRVGADGGQRSLQLGDRGSAGYLAHPGANKAGVGPHNRPHRLQLPLALSDDSEPEPDVAVVALGNYDAEHPTSALL